jgi:DNA-binding transcriptional MocR family regulator
MANHNEVSFIWNGKKQILREGQLLTGLKKLSEKTGIAQATVYRILKYLENEKQIEQQKTTKYTVITILNWGRYQGSEKQNEKQMKNKWKTDEKQMKTYNNDNNNNNEDKIYICSFESFWRVYPKRVAKKKANDIYNRIATSKKIEECIMQGLQNYIKKWRSEKTDVQYIPNPTTWLNQKRWEDEIQISNIQFNKNARQFEDEWEQKKLKENKKYQSYLVDDGKGGLAKLSEIMKKH